MDDNLDYICPNPIRSYNVKIRITSKTKGLPVNYMENSKNMEWINPKERKPEGKVFWALTAGRDEQGYRDWEIRRLWNDEHGDYRTLDFAGSYSLPDSYNGQSQFNTIHAWLHLECININDYEINSMSY